MFNSFFHFQPMNSSESSPTAAARTASGPRFHRSHYVLGIAALIVIAVVATYLTRPAAAAETSAAHAPTGPKVTVAAVEERLFVDQRELLGRVEAKESVEIRPRVSGHIEEVRLQAGQQVNAGDILFVIDPRWYQAQLDLTSAQVESAKIRVAIAGREARRSEGLLAEHAISVEEADVRSTRLAEARAELLAAEAQLATARLDLQHTEVRAPISGQVSRATVTAGNLVSGAPGAATLLTTIVSTGDIFVYADVDEATVLSFNRIQREGRLVLENGHVPVDMALSDETGFPHHGYVESSDNRLDPQTGTLVVRLVFSNADGRLVPGLSAKVRLPVSAPQKALLVSERAIGTDQSQKFVLTVADDNTVGYRAVKLGPLVDGQRIVRDGLHAGERIIVNGLQRARPGMTVVAEYAPAKPVPTGSTKVALK
ncbi:MAG: rane protein [Verrucomicrobia bacterium]|nr:rane protein [Verrucomicrobiota bacterium]